MIDRKVFFDTVRQKPFGGQMTQKQVSGMNAILNEWQNRKLTDLRWLAYMLATAYHETAHTMQPIAEFGRGKGRKYGKAGRNMGQVAYGRGYVQLTWDENYERADKELKLHGSLVRNYNLALDPDIAAAIMFEGMIEGWFTTRKLSHYFTASKTDWTNARRIINGTDKASTIAGYAKDFHAALKAADRQDAVAQPAEPVQPPSPPDDPMPVPEEEWPYMSPAEPVSGKTFWTVIAGVVVIIIAAVFYFTKGP